MGKQRAYELSKELGFEIKELVAYAKKAGVTIKNHMSSLDEAETAKIVHFIDKLKRESVVEKRVGRRVIRRRAVRPKAVKQVEKESLPETQPEATEEIAVEAEPEKEAIEVVREKEPVSEPVEADDKETPLQDGEPDEVLEPPQVQEVEETPAIEETVEDKAEKPLAVAEAEPVAEKTDGKPEAVAVEEAVPDAEVPVSPEAVEEETVQVETAAPEAESEKKAKAASKKEEKDKAPKAKGKKKARKIRQISKIVKVIDLEDLEPATPRRPPGRSGPGGRPYSRPGRPAQRGPGRPPVPTDVIVPPPELAGRRRRPDKENSYGQDGASRRRGSKGFRKRQVIDDSYFNQRNRGRRKKGQGKKAPSVATVSPKAIKRTIRMASESIVVGELAKRMGIKASEVILKLMNMGLQVMVNQAIDVDTASIVASEFGYEVENVAFEEEQFISTKIEDPEDQLEPRWPIVTVMGHVDHGKTSILDYIRTANVASGEAGGITQHIGAYVVRRKSGNLTFIDTPGHEAFTSMRARGAQVTDIVILVVAADDGVMPQTVEAIKHARAAEVPIVVAINKIDKDNANPDKVRNELMQHELVSENLGGDTIIIEVSAHTGQGIEELLEMVLLQAEVLELKANPKREQVEAIVLEGKLDRGRGPVATILIRQGTLNVGDNFVCGSQSSRVKAMVNDKSKRCKKAGPSEPVEILGFNEVPEAGDPFNTIKDEKQAKAIADFRYRKKRDAELAKSSRVSLEELVERVKSGERQTLPLVVKGDVQGTVEALRDSLVKLSTDEVKIDIVTTGVGGITESDVLYASASEALIVGFNIRAESKAQSLAESEGVQIKLYTVIYDVIEEVQAAILGLMKPEIREEVIGHVEVRDTFTIPKIGTIAGSYVIDGKVIRDAMVRLYRENVAIYSGKIASLRRFKDDVNEVASGYECGVSIENYNDIKVGDTIEFYLEKEIQPTLPTQ